MPFELGLGFWLFFSFVTLRNSKQEAVGSRYCSQPCLGAPSSVLSNPFKWSFDQPSFNFGEHSAEGSGEALQRCMEFLSKATSCPTLCLQTPGGPALSPALPCLPALPPPPAQQAGYLCLCPPPCTTTQKRSQGSCWAPFIVLPSLGTSHSLLS